MNCRSGLSLNVVRGPLKARLGRCMVFRRFDHAAQSLDATLLSSPSKHILNRVSIFRCFNRCALCLNALLLKRASRPALIIIYTVKYRQFYAKNWQLSNKFRL